MLPRGNCISNASNLFKIIQILNPCDPFSPHTLESKDKKIIILECKEIDQMLRILDHKNINKKKNCFTPAKLESKNKDKKILAPRDCSIVLEEATSHQNYSIRIIQFIQIFVTDFHLWCILPLVFVRHRLNL